MTLEDFAVQFCPVKFNFTGQKYFRGLYRTLPDINGLYRTLPDFTGLYRTLPDLQDNFTGRKSNRSPKVYRLVIDDRSINNNQPHSSMCVRCCVGSHRFSQPRHTAHSDGRWLRRNDERPGPTAAVPTARSIGKVNRIDMIHIVTFRDPLSGFTFRFSPFCCHPTKRI